MNIKETLDGLNMLKEGDFSENAQRDLKHAATWARFISIMLYLIFVLLIFVTFLSIFYINLGVQMFGIFFLYTMLCIFVFSMAQKLMKFSNQILGAMMQQSASLSHDAFLNLHLYLRLCFFASVCWLVYVIYDFVF